jgi:hypothetical protein
MILFVEEDGKILLLFPVPLRMFALFSFKLLDLILNPELLGGVICFRY